MRDNHKIKGVDFTRLLIWTVYRLSTTLCVCVCVHVHACVCACVYICVCVLVLYVLNLENVYIQRMCMHFGPVQVRCFKYPLLSLLFTDVNEKENKMDGNRSVHKGRTPSENSRKWLNIPIMWLLHQHFCHELLFCFKFELFRVQWYSFALSK